MVAFACDMSAVVGASAFLWYGLGGIGWGVRGSGIPADIRLARIVSQRGGEMAVASSTVGSGLSQSFRLFRWVYDVPIVEARGHEGYGLWLIPFCLIVLVHLCCRGCRFLFVESSARVQGLQRSDREGGGGVSLLSRLARYGFHDY